MGAKNVNLKEDYEVGKIGYWPSFTSTTKKKNIALGFSNRGNDKSFVLMKIFLSTRNDPVNHIDCQQFLTGE